MTTRTLFQWASILILSLAIFPTCPLFAADAPAEFYISPEGSDENPGTFEKPLATLAGARDLIRKNKASLSGNITVYLKDGSYTLREPFVLESQDSPAGSAALLFAAAPGANPLLTGGVPVTGWTKQSDNRWTASIPKETAAMVRFPQLFRDGKRLTRARFPNEGYLTIVKVTKDLRQLQFDQKLPDENAPGPDAMLVCLLDWIDSRVNIDRIQGDTLFTRQPAGWIGHRNCSSSPKRKAWLENSIAFLDQPGEWVLDKNSGVITYFARVGENPNDHAFILPLTTQLLLLKGKPNNPIQNIQFQGIAFAYTDWDFPAFGYRGIQACYHGTSEKPLEPVYPMPAAAQWTWAQNCSLTQCTFAHTNASALALGAGCTDNKIERCEFFDIGGNGVHLGFPNGPLADYNKDWYTAGEVPQNNEVRNCTLRQCGAVSVGAVGIFTAYCENTLISHNLICDLPYTGISSGFAWHDKPTNHKGTIIEWNHIHHVMTRLTDGGGIYTLGLQPGAVMRGNHIHDLPKQALPYGAPSNGFFIDQGTTAIHFEDNIIYNIGDEPIRFNISEKENQTWGKNYLGITPDRPEFPKDLAAQAGPVPASKP